ncbi:MAG: glycosyltransferase family 2 protein [Candidatus Acetothermia bacterium]
MNDVLMAIVLVYNSFVLLYFFAINSAYLLLLILSAFEVGYHISKPDLTGCSGQACELVPTISVLVPAYNESQTITSSIEALQALEYPQLEIIVINDGSTDESMRVLRRDFKLVSVDRDVDEKLETEAVNSIYKSITEENLLVLDKENGGKADALNAGINYTRSDLFVAVDADTLIEKDSLWHLVAPYLENPTRVVGVGGIVRIANNCKIENSEILEARLPRRFLPAVQVMEYIRAFLFGRAGWSRIQGLPIISGAFGLFERDAAVEIGGYRTDTVGEDMDLVLRLHRQMRDEGQNYQISFVPVPVCWTQAPSSLRVLSRQRNRWQRGLAESLTYNWRMICNPRYGPVGLAGLPFFFFFELLGPVVEVSGYLVFLVSFALGWINLPFALTFITVAVLYGVFLSLSALTLEEFTLKRYDNPWDRVKLLGLAVLENLGYRQLHAFWRVKGLFDFLRKSKSWGEMTRQSFDSPSDE